MGAFALSADTEAVRPDAKDPVKPFKARTMSGLLSSLLLFAASFFVGILLTPFLVDRLGVAAYGLVPLSFSIANFLALATQVITAIVNQKLVASERDPSLFNHYFSIFFYICAALAAAAILAFVLLRQPIVDSLNVSDALEPGAQMLLIASAASVALSLFSTPVCAVIYAIRGVDLINLGRFLDTIVRVLLIVILFYVWTPSLEIVALGLAGGALAGALAIAFAAVAQRPSLRLVWPKGARTTLRSLSGLGAGVVLIQAGSLLFSSTELILANMWFGADAAGLYAVSIQWALVVRNLGFSLASTFVATVMRGFHQEPAGVKRQIIDGMYVLAAVVALVGGFCVGASEPLMTVWLGPSYAGMSNVLSVSAMLAAFGVTVSPLFALCLASGRVLFPGVVNVGAGLLYIATFVVLETLVGVGPVGLAAIWAACYTGHQLIFSLPYAASQIGARLRDFARPLSASIYWTICAALLAMLVTMAVEPASFLALAICGLAVTPAYVGVVLLTLPGDQRALLIARLRHVLDRAGLRK
jgi:O-antigen/teichoic acid export membrane protein